MKKILVVDDKADIRKLIKILLDFRYEVMQIGSADEASHLIGQWCPDLILLDIMMPGMDGLQWCQRLKNENATKAIKVIMVSARATKNDIEAGMTAGADDYIAKPFSPLKLLSAIEALLS